MLHHLIRKQFFLIIFILAATMATPLAARGEALCPYCQAERLLGLQHPPLRGPDVIDLQLRLAQLGYYIGPLHGVYESSTRRAVINFQKGRGLKPSGQIDVTTWQALAAGTSIAGTATATPPPPNQNLKVIIDTDRLTLTILVEGRAYRQYPIAIGKYTSPSPVGEWKIIDKAYEAGGAFGTRWMGLNVPWGNYGIHGTNRPWSIGWAASAGCFRMYNEDIEEIYPWLPVGTPVVVKGPHVPPRGPLKPGYGSPQVVTLQARLREKGFYPFGPTDGDYGLMTEVAVKGFQLYNGLPATGIADTATLKALGFEVAAAEP